MELRAEIKSEYEYEFLEFEAEFKSEYEYEFKGEEELDKLDIRNNYLKYMQIQIKIFVIQTTIRNNFRL